MNTLDEVKARAMQEQEFFKALVVNKDTAKKLKSFLVKKGLPLSDKDIATLYLLLNFGTRPVTAVQYLGIKKGDDDIRGVWVS
jgi:hypothetical protein